MPHLNESCQSEVQVSRRALERLCHTPEQVMSHTWMRHATLMNKPFCTHADAGYGRVGDGCFDGHGHGR